MKLYRVEITGEMYVVANDDCQAEAEARRCIDDEPAISYTATEIKNAPAYVLDTYPWGGCGDKTIKQILE
jgi:hypothetical protein